MSSYEINITCPKCGHSGHTTGECDDEGNALITYGECIKCDFHFGWDDDLGCAVIDGGEE